MNLFVFFFYFSTSVSIIFFDERCKGMSLSGTIKFYCIALYSLKLNICFFFAGQQETEQ